MERNYALEQRQKQQRADQVNEIAKELERTMTDKPVTVTQADVDAYWKLEDFVGEPPRADQPDFKPCVGMVIFARHRTAHAPSQHSDLADRFEIVVGSKQYRRLVSQSELLRLIGGGAAIASIKALRQSHDTVRRDALEAMTTDEG